MFVGKKSLRSPSLSAKRRRRFLLYVGLPLVLALFLLVGLVYLAGAPEISITEIEITGETALSEEEILKVVRRELEGNYLYFFPKKNIFIYPKNKIAENILKEMPRIGEVAITSRDLHGLSVAIKERDAVGLWCAGHPQAEGDCYFLDSGGFIFAEAPTFSSDIFFRYYGLLESTKLVGLTFLDQAELQRTTYLSRGLRELGLIPKALFAKSSKEREIYFGKGKVIFNSERDYGEILRNLQALLQGEPFRGVVNANLEIEYVDLRLNQKVFYKIRGK